MKHMKKILAICLALVMVLTCIPVANAATSTEATIDEDAECSLRIVKYDWTNAYKDGWWDEDSFTSTGALEPYVEDHLCNVIRPGDQNQNIDHILGNPHLFLPLARRDKGVGNLQGYKYALQEAHIAPKGEGRRHALPWHRVYVLHSTGARDVYRLDRV